MSENFNVSLEDSVEIAKTEMDFFAAIAAPEVYTLAFPPIFLVIWQMLTTAVLKTERAFDKFAIGLPRGFGKSNVIRLLVLYAILFSQKRYILIVCAAQNLAINILSDVFDMLEEPNVISMFGRWDIAVEKDTQDMKVFTFRNRSIIIQAAGAEQAIRGTNRKQDRPDLIIFDDAQTKENAESPTLAMKFRAWVYGTALKLKSPFGCTSIYVGNMYPNMKDDKGKFTCLLRNLKDDTSWISYIVGGILQNGESLWEELQPVHQLLDELQLDTDAGHPEIFMSEVMNDPDCQVNNMVDLTKVPQVPEEFTGDPEGSFIILDPATSKKKSDDQASVYYEIFDGKSVATDLMITKLAASQLVESVITWALEKRCPLICIEDVAFQYELVGLFESRLQQLGVSDIKIRTVMPRGVRKNKRISEMFKRLLAGDLYLHSNIRAQVFFQIASFNPLKEDNKDDILDDLAYETQVMTEHLMDTYRPDSVLTLTSGDYAVIEDNTPF